MTNNNVVCHPTLCLLLISSCCFSVSPTHLSLFPLFPPRSSLWLSQRSRVILEMETQVRQSQCKVFYLKLKLGRCGEKAKNTFLEISSNWSQVEQEESMGETENKESEKSGNMASQKLKGREFLGEQSNYEKILRY